MFEIGLLVVIGVDVVVTFWNDDEATFWDGEVVGSTGLVAFIGAVIEGADELVGSAGLVAFIGTLIEGADEVAGSTGLEAFIGAVMEDIDEVVVRFWNDEVEEMTGLVALTGVEAMDELDEVTGTVWFPLTTTIRVAVREAERVTSDIKVLTELAVAVVVLDSVTTLEAATTCVLAEVVTAAPGGAVEVTVVLGPAGVAV